jgi:cyclopropane-fatty-acyl-phospholipid synthase
MSSAALPREGLPARRANALERLARRSVRARLARIRRGALALDEGLGAVWFGDPAHPVKATIRVRDPGFYRALLLRGGVGAGEAWMDGLWHCDDLTAALRVAAMNRSFLADLERGPARLAGAALRLLHARRRNTRRGARHNVAAHYDLGNEFFARFLDPTLTYSCALFERESMGLEQAQRAKYDRLCRKLALCPRDRVLEIGSGWGGFAIHAASRYGCRVTSVTISRAQWELARRRVAEAGLAGRVEIQLRDYRDLSGRYDKLVSIEMIEAVGAANLVAFFRACRAHLESDGLMALQAITIPEQDWEASLRSVDFVKRHVFPGGQLVSLGSLLRAMAGATDLRVTHLEDLSPHYATTLARWRERLGESRDAVRRLGLPERFLRMWEYYLCYCEAGFAERATGVVQVLLAGPDARRAPVLGALA